MRLLCIPALALSALACSPAVESVSLPPPKRPVAAAAPELPHPARWQGLTPFHTVEPYLGLANGDRFYVGDLGRRLVMRTDGFTEATHLAPERLIAVRPNGSAYRFFGAFGSIFESKAPLSSLETIAPGAFPTDAIPEFGVGERNALAIVGGAIFESIDGAPFQPIVGTKIGIPSWATPRNVAFNGKGHGVLLASPQRLFETSDDGKTWKRIEPSREGAAGLLVDAKGHLHAHSITIPETIVPFDGTNTTNTKVNHFEVGAPSFSKTAVFFADRVAQIDDTRLEIVRVDGTRLVTTLKKPIDWIAGQGEELIALSDEMLLRSTDGGAHFVDELAWKSNLGPRKRILVEGHALAIASCDDTCTDVHARAAPGIPLHAVAPIDDAVVLDVALSRGTMFLLGSDHGRLHLYAGAPSATKLERFGTLDEPAHELTAGRALSIDEGGVVRAIVMTEARSLLLRVDPSGVARPPVPIAHDVMAASLSGARGLAAIGVGSEDYLVETDDGGEHWTRVGGPSLRSIACSPLGCSVDGVARFGWDLPTSADRPRTEAKSPQVVTTKTITCTPKGTKETLGEDARVLPVITNAGLALAIVESAPLQLRTIRIVGPSSPAAGKGKEQPLMLKIAPQKKGAKSALIGGIPRDTDVEGRVVSTKVGAIPAGVLAVRTHFAGSFRKADALSPVEVELGWWSSSSQKIHRASLGIVAPFRISLGSETIDGEAAVLEDDALFFHPRDATTAWFVTPEGKARLVPFPASTRLHGAARKGTLLRFHGATSAGDVVGGLEDFAILHVLGWTFGDESTHLVSFGGVPHLATPRALFTLEELSTSVPDPTLRSIERPSCVATTSPHAIVDEDADLTKALLIDTAGEKPFKVSSPLAAIDTKGNSCIAARRFWVRGFKASRDVVWTGKASAWLHRGNTLQPLVCTD